MPRSKRTTTVDGDVTFSTKTETQGVSSTGVADPVPAHIKDIKNALENRAEQVEASFNSLERRMDRLSTFLYSIASIMITVVVATFILIGLDYFKTSGERYENFVDKVQEVKNSSYSKEDVDSYMASYYTKQEVDSNLRTFKDCIWVNGLTKCLR